MGDIISVHPRNPVRITCLYRRIQRRRNAVARTLNQAKPLGKKTRTQRMDDFGSFNSVVYDRYGTRLQGLRGDAF